jgi:hypothetical protein
VQAQHSEKEEPVVMTTEQAEPDAEMRENEVQPAVAPGPPMAFKDALAASMAKFDAVLHRLAK